MPFEIVISEVNEHSDQLKKKVYEQTVADLDLPRIIAAINAKKRVYTKRATKGAP